jgi:DNA-binding LacI/PurR family transcriptional regulator
MTPRPSITDVAAAAGVSITTVSHALSGKGRLSKETRDHVRRVAEQAGYEPNMHARGLATGRTMLLGMQASGLESRTLVPQYAYYLDVINAASASAMDHGYALVLLAHNAPEDKVRRFSLDGGVIIDPMGDETLMGVLRYEDKPLVTIGRIPGRRATNATIDTDHQAAAWIMLDHLAEVGCRKPALLTSGRRGPSYVTDGTRGYRSWCAHRGIKPRVITVKGNPNELTGQDAIGAVLDAAPKGIDGVYATLDALAMGAMRAAHARALDVPGELAIAALTDSPSLRAAAPGVTALDLHPEQLGARAIERLVAMIDGEIAGVAPASVPVEIIRRPSTTAPVTRAERSLV